MCVFSEATEYTVDSYGHPKKNSPIESQLRKCAIKLLQNPPVGQTRRTNILQSTFSNKTRGAIHFQTSLENIAARPRRLLWIVPCLSLFTP
jgi:hypothetical protein